MTSRRTIPVMLFVLVWLSCGWFGSWEYNPNNSTRLFAAISLVEDHDATIDAFKDLTIDKAQFGDHVYLDKAPGMTLMAVPVVAVANAVTGERSVQFDKWLGNPDLARFMRARVRLAAIFGSALLTAIAAVLLYDLALGMTGRAGASLFASLGYALGSPIWGWSTTIFGHASVAALYVVAVWAVWRGTRGAAARPGLAALAGLALGWAVVVEYQAVLGGAAIGLWALWRIGSHPGRWRVIGAALAGGVVALTPLFAYNIVAFGTLFRIGYSGVVGFEGMNQGLFGLTSPKPAVLWEILFGIRRGLLWVAPVLVVAPLGLAHMVEDRKFRDFALMVIAVVAIVLLVNAAYVYWDGGHSTGPRHAMPMVGLLAVGLAPFWARLRSRGGRIAAATLLGVSMALNVMIAAAEIVAPDTYRFPIWSRVIVEKFLPGNLRDLPGEYWGWTPWAGFALYLVLAMPLLMLLVRAATLSDKAMPR